MFGLIKMTEQEVILVTGELRIVLRSAGIVYSLKPYIIN